MKLPSGWIFLPHYKCKLDGIEVEIEQQELIRCKDCKFFEYDHLERVDGKPIIVAHEICNFWGNGCKTSENGFCYKAEPMIQDARGCDYGR